MPDGSSKLRGLLITRSRLVSRTPSRPNSPLDATGFKPDVALPLERAALLRQFGRDQIVAAILGQGRETVELDPERFQHGVERLARTVGVDVDDVAFVDPDVVDQYPRDRVGRRFLVFIQLGDQCRPVEPAAGPHLDGGVRLIELDIPDAPGPAEQPGGVEVDVEPLETRQRRAAFLGQFEAVDRSFQCEGVEL